MLAVAYGQEAGRVKGLVVDDAESPIANADVQLKRGDGVDYKVRAGKDAALYICVEPAGLTDCFGSKLH